LYTDGTYYAFNIFTFTLRTLFFVFVMLFERLDDVKIMTATVTFEFVDWHGFSKIISVFALYSDWYFSS
jgi:hypothetical protein